MAKFAASNYVNVFTGVIPFFADYGFYPQTDIKPPGTYKGEKKEEQQAELLAANKIVV